MILKILDLLAHLKHLYLNKIYMASYADMQKKGSSELQIKPNMVVSAECILEIKMNRRLLLMSTNPLKLKLESAQHSSCLTFDV